MLTDKFYCKTDWKYSAVNYCLNEKLKKYLLKNEKMPTILFASNNMGNLYPHSIVGYAIKYKLKIVFIHRKGSENPWFCFGKEGDEL